MLDTSTHDSIDAIPAAEWNALFPDEIEDHAYLRAIEHAELAGFRYRYFSVRDGGRLVAAVPAFITDYRVDTTMEGAPRRIVRALTPLAPRLLRMPMLALGSPVTERCRVGVAADANTAQRAAWLDAILAHMDVVAARAGCRMLAVKDVPADAPAWQDACPRQRLREMPGLPGATLDVRWNDVESYVGALGAATRKNLRRERRAGAALAIEWRTDLDGLADDVERLYRQTLAHAEFSFEELTPAYFINVLRDMPGRAACVTYRENGRLVAFNLVLHDQRRLLDKFLGMDYTVMDRYNLYHVTWLENVRWCIEHGIRTYEAGQGLQREKQRLGATLHPNAIWYRHRNRIVDSVFRHLDGMARMDRRDTAPVPVKRR